ncbi:hypothetical protein KPL28_11775 [Clostridium algidicarnis]|uniref:hypothetical protein n=1 Tax=Clostridium algidicarnis TaxID=37659 RepID=UPI001C0DEF09|nr:hypothetical protein [Clostridium algidicarnis]MBU3210297.1 hypothetical protein [Clostridium algidicarnis]
MLNELNLLRKQNQTNTKELIDINQELLSRILKYVQISKIGAFDREIIRKDLIGMAIEAEKRGKTLSDIIGADEKSWCDSLVDSYGKVSPIELILSILKQASIYWFIWGILFFGITPSIVNIDIRWVSVFFLYVCIIIVYNLFVSSKFAFQSSINQFLIAFMVFIIITLLIWIITKFSNGIVLFTIPNYTIHSVFGVTLVASTFLYNNLIHEQAKKINWME